MNPHAVECRGLTKCFKETIALADVNLFVQQGEILAVVGPSGCGKTTLLRLIAGFEQPDGGKILIQGGEVAGITWAVAPERRGVGMVFQEYALFPHLTVGQNIRFGLNGQPGKEQSVQEELARVGMRGYENRYPHELSGGERQRVALARALAPKPVLVLLDEPFSNLDAERRETMREEVRAILKTAGAAALFVTHDQGEALYMGDRLAVLNHGRLEQIGSPEDVFERPRTRFVAEFMGQTDFLPAVVTAEGLASEAGLIRQRVSIPPGKTVDVAVRPDDVDFELQEDGPAAIVARSYKGGSIVYRLRLPSGRMLHSWQPHTRLAAPGARVSVRVNPGHDLAWYSAESTKQG
jgi:iron(III) transport system ATP-binding protein